MNCSTPKLPAIDWDTFDGKKNSNTPCLLEHSGTHFTVSGRAAILLALEMFQVGPGKKVLVPTYHCPTMVAPIVALGAEPIFYPIDKNGSPVLSWLQHTRSADVHVILVTHLFGLPQPLLEIRSWCDQHGVRLIEDCAHALFGVSDDRAVGLWGDLAIASLTKFLPVSEGGCLVNNLVQVPLPQLQSPSFKSQIKAAFDILHTSINHNRLAVLAPLIRTISRLSKLLKSKSNSVDPVPPADAPFGDGFVIDVAQSHIALTRACCWIAKHAHRQRIVARRRENYEFFARELSEVPGLHPLHANLPANCAPYVFPLWVGQPDPGYAELRRLMFPVSRWDRLWPNVATIDGDMGLTWSHHVLQLACHQDMTPPELRQMVDTLKRVYTHVPSGQLTHPA